MTTPSGDNEANKNADPQELAKAPKQPSADRADSTTSKAGKKADQSDARLAAQQERLRAKAKIEAQLAQARAKVKQGKTPKEATRETAGKTTTAPQTPQKSSSQPQLAAEQLASEKLASSQQTANQANKQITNAQIANPQLANQHLTAADKRVSGKADIAKANTFSAIDHGTDSDGADSGGADSGGAGRNRNNIGTNNPAKVKTDTHPGIVEPRFATRTAHRDVAPSGIVPFGHPIETATPPQGKIAKRAPHPPVAPKKGVLHGVSKLVKNIFWAAVFGSTAVAAAGLGTLAVLTFPLPRQVSGETVAPPLSDLWRSGFRYQVSRPVNILVMGLDEAYDLPEEERGELVGRTDTMLLARVDPEEQAVNVMSIPRDTRVEIPGYGIEKINQANFEGGAELAAQTVSYNFDNVAIDRYVRVSTSAFKEIVDLVGGIEVLVPKEMKYEDKTQGLVIDLQPGLQNLNGDEAEQFARFRQDSYGDIGRVQRQQILLKALRQRMMNPTVLTKLPQIIRVLQEHIDTNLSVEELLALAGFGLNLDSTDLNMVMLPGRFSDPEEYSASYWLSDREASSDLMRTYFDAQPGELVANSNGVNYYEPPSNWSVLELKIAVQNATDDQYASFSMAEYLRDQGFYNVYVVRDWAEVNRKTSVVVQRGDVGSARSLQDMLDIGQVVSDSTGDIDSDITVRVGEDWLMQMDPDWQRLPYDGPR